MNKPRRGKGRDAALLLGGTALGAVAMLAVTALSKSPGTIDTAQVAASFPNTTFDRIAHDPASGMVVAEAGQTILYLSDDLEKVFVGDVIDLKARVNLTDQRRTQLASVLDIEAKAMGRTIAELPGAAPEPAAPARPSRAEPDAVIDVAGLDEAGLVISNPGAGPVLYVVSDYNCSYCNRLHQTLKGFDNVEIREIPVGFLNPDSGIKAASVLCSDDKEAAAAAMFARGGGTITTCSEGEALVAQNTAWMSANRIGGTPFMLREDGTWLSGAVPAAQIRTFLGVS